MSQGSNAEDDINLISNLCGDFELEALELQAIKIKGLEGKTGSVIEVDRLSDQFSDELCGLVESAVKSRRLRLSEMVEKLPLDVISSNKLAKLPREQSGFSYDVIQQGSILERRDKFFVTYTGGKKTDAGVSLIGLNAIDRNEADKINNDISGNEKRRVVVVYVDSAYTQDGEKTGITNLNDTNIGGSPERLVERKIAGFKTVKGFSSVNAVCPDTVSHITQLLINTPNIKKYEVESKLSVGVSLAIRKKSDKADLNLEK